MPEHAEFELFIFVSGMRRENGDANIAQARYFKDVQKESGGSFSLWWPKLQQPVIKLG